MTNAERVEAVRRTAKQQIETAERIGREIRAADMSDDQKAIANVTNTLSEAIASVTVELANIMDRVLALESRPARFVVLGDDLVVNLGHIVSAQKQPEGGLDVYVPGHGNGGRGFVHLRDDAAAKIWAILTSRNPSATPAAEPGDVPPVV